MPADTLDTAAVSRLLAQVADQPADRAEAFFERRVERTLPAEGDPFRPRVLSEQGFAVRLLRNGRSWHASRDGLDPVGFVESLRQICRTQPRGALVEPALGPLALPSVAPLDGAEGRDFLLAVERAIRAHHVAFPLRLELRQILRSVQVVGPRLVSEMQQEAFFSVHAEFSWGRCGALLWALDAASAEALGTRLAARFRARFAAPPAAGRGVLVMGPDAAAVLLHEAVAHTLEADVLALSGNPDAALGVRLGAGCLNVLDDPGAAPEPVRRSSDDEGSPVLRRWLLRGGVVEQPLADGLWADGSAALLPGAGRRAHRHALPGPRSTFLELLPGESAEAELLREADGGVWLPEVERGALDPLDGVFTVIAPYARAITSAGLGEYVGPCRLRCTVSDLLSRVTALASEARPGGAGWCAKDGQALPVWARAPAIRLEGVAWEPA